MLKTAGDTAFPDHASLYRPRLELDLDFPARRTQRPLGELWAFEVLRRVQQGRDDVAGRLRIGRLPPLPAKVPVVEHAVTAGKPVVRRGVLRPRQPLDGLQEMRTMSGFRPDARPPAPCGAHVGLRD